ncbi:hypothetical protein, partial [Sulfitobacter sp.]|uniref:hypothetical protein n=1 Tax=Sulfitobacter sp. TaxID=1903071 RepID=UPI00300116A8
TINQKSRTVVRVSAATWQRHDFDELADRIYSAVGQPTKAELRASRLKRKDRKKLRSGGTMPKGLTAPQRFSLILQDLEDIKRHYGGRPRRYEKHLAASLQCLPDALRAVLGCRGGD